MIPGSNQSPSDIETMDMVLNAEGNRFVEAYKDIEIVRTIAVQRLTKMCDDLLDLRFSETILEADCFEWLRGKLSINDATMIPGDTIYDKSRFAFLAMRAPEGRKAIAAFKEKQIEAIRVSGSAEEMLSISRDEKALLSITEEECPACMGFLSDVPSPHKISTIFARLDANCGSDVLRKLVNTFSFETKISETPFEGELGSTLKLARPDMLDVLGVEHELSALDRIGREVGCKWVANDRSKTLLQPLKMSATDMPQVGSFDSSFTDVADSRAADLWSEKKPIILYWSGGIDSTTALVALLKIMPHDGDLTICCNENSVAEYPEFFRKHIEGKLTVHTPTIKDVPTDRFYISSAFDVPVFANALTHLENSLLVTGELGDQIFGSVAFVNDASKINGDLEDYLSQFSETRDEIDALNAACPIPIKSITTLLWWWNFSCKWEEVVWRSLVHLDGDINKFKNIRHFFNTPDFQRWSIANDDLKIKDTIASYKWIAKDYIHDFSNDDDYRQNKIKVGSLGVFLGKALGVDNKDTFIAAGDTSTDVALIRQRYGDQLQRFLR